MANYGPNDTQLVVVVGMGQWDIDLYFDTLPRSSEITYRGFSLLSLRRLEGLRANRIILTPIAQSELLRARTLVHGQDELESMARRCAIGIERPDGI